ncbi:MAG: hypothetical protein JNJ54_07875 [Myxococcaceae bacterium]|nr:hypothetical protein [Myxococcaceae bacterium]
MRTCEDFERAIISGDGGDALGAHLAGCAGCRRFAAAHRAAGGVRHLEPRLRARHARTAVVRRASLVAVLLIALLSAGLWSSRAPTSTATAPEALVPALPETARAASPAPDDERDWAALVAFTQTLDDTLYRDVTTNDATYAAFGALPRWVAPQSTLTALEN